MEGFRRLLPFRLQSVWNQTEENSLKTSDIEMQYSVLPLSDRNNSTTARRQNNCGFEMELLDILDISCFHYVANNIKRTLKESESLFSL